MYRRPLDKYGNEDTRYPENWSKLRFYVFKRDKYKCRICGRSSKYLQCHHVMPVGRGGNSNPNNLITCCRSCHKRLHNLR